MICSVAAPTVLVKPTCEIPLPVIYNQCVSCVVLLRNTEFDVIGQPQPCAVYKNARQELRSGDRLRAQSSAEEKTPVTDGESGQREACPFLQCCEYIIHTCRQTEAAPDFTETWDVIGFGKRTGAQWDEASWHQLNGIFVCNFYRTFYSLAFMPETNLSI